MNQINMFHSSGKWDMTDSPAFDRNIRMMRRFNTVGTRTEATDHDFDNELKSREWDHWHPQGVGHDCSVEWHNGTWEFVDKGVLQLTGIRITTTKGVQLRPNALTWVVLRHNITGIEVEFGAAHLDLANTALRVRANLQECWSLRKHYRQQRKSHPERRFVLNFDGNRNQKLKRWRAYFAANLLAGTGMKSMWKMPLPEGGTHGKSLLDLCISDMTGRSRLAADDRSSDHRPFYTTLNLTPKKDKR